MRVTQHQFIRKILSILLCFVGCLNTALNAGDINKSSQPLAPTKDAPQLEDSSSAAVTVPVDAKTVTATDAEALPPLGKSPEPADSSDSTEKAVAKANHARTTGLKAELSTPTFSSAAFESSSGAPSHSITSIDVRLNYGKSESGNALTVPVHPS